LGLPLFLLPLGIMFPLPTFLTGSICHLGTLYKKSELYQIAGIVDIEPDSQTARGRWQGWGVIALPKGGGIENFFIHGIYEVEYVKEGGKWKFKTLQFNRTYSIPPGEGLVKPERLVPMDPNKIAITPDLPRSVDPSYPAGYIVPFHFRHPVTGKVTSEGKRNASRRRKS
jgi:hypothetical protein